MLEDSSKQDFYCELKKLFDQAVVCSSVLEDIQLDYLAQKLLLLLEGSHVEGEQWVQVLYWLSYLSLWKSQRALLYPLTKFPLKRVVDGKAVFLPVVQLDGINGGEPFGRCSQVVFLGKGLSNLSLTGSTEKGVSNFSVADLQNKTGVPANAGNWPAILKTWREDQTLNAYLSQVSVCERIAVFQDLLLRQQKGELFLTQESSKDVLYIKRVVNPVAGYG